MSTAWEEGEVKAAKKRQRRPRRQSAQEVQQSLVDFMDDALWPDAFYAARQPSERVHSHAQFARLRSLGVRSGWPSIQILWRGQSYFIIVKEIDGDLTASERSVFGRLEAAGAEIAVTFGLEPALMQLARWGLIRGNAEL